MAAGAELRAVQSIRGEPGVAAIRQAFSNPSYPDFPQGLHDPQTRRGGFRVSKHTRRAPPFGLGGARAKISHRIFKDHPQYPDILILRRDRPGLARISGTLFLLDGTGAIALAFFRQD